MNGQILLMIISFLIQIFSLSIGVYYVIVGLFGFIPIKDINKVRSNKINKFALITSAHNEEDVIENLIRSMQQLDYPTESYDIFIIADNCTDNTAETARKAGAIVYERNVPDKRGKGFALEWMFEKIFAMDKKYDYISIFDADNLIDKNYLKEMNIQANRGYKVVQGYVDSKNPFDSWITSAYSISFWSISRTFQLARYRLSLCCQLSGTGFIVATDTLKELGWGATCLTEDMEFTMKLALCNQRVAWANNAKIYDEKPIKLMQSWRQRKRWMQGHCDVASRFFFKLVKKAFREKNLAPLDCAVYLVQPIRIIAMAVILFFSYAQSFYPDGNLGFIQLNYIFKNPIILNIVLIMQMLYLPLVVTIERKKFNLKYLWAYITYMLYNFTWIPIAVQGMINKNKTEWCHTKHTRSLSIEELEGAKNS